MLLQLKHRTLVPSLHAETLSQAIDFSKTPFVVQRHRDAWQRPRVEADSGTVEAPRRAGVTSIGAGGVNVHIVVEEHDGRVVAAPDSGRPQLLVFSAVTPTALAGVLADLLRHVRRTDPTLDALAYGLQTGKNELPCRLAVVAGDISEAAHRLERLGAVDWSVDAPPLPEGVHYTASILRQRRGADPAAVEQAVEQGRLDEIAGHWTSGASVDWDRLWPEGTRPAKLSLPGYPFEKVRCWYPEYEDAPSVLRPLSFTRRAHPWVGANRSDLNGVRYTLALRGDELLDYVYTVGRTRRYVTLALLDGALAFARLAGVGEGPLRIRNAQWGALPSPGDAPASLEWRLGTSGDGRHRVELWHLDDTAPTLRFAADVLTGAPVSAAPPPDLSAAPPTLDRDGFYDTLADAGVDARPYAQSVESVTVLDGQRLLVRVGAPAVCQDPHKQRVLLTAWTLSGITQGVLYLQATTGPAVQDGVLAASELDSLHGDGLERTRAIVLTWEPGAAWRISATLLDEQGRVLGQLDNATFTTGPLPSSLRGASGPASVASRPVSLPAPEQPVPSPSPPEQPGPLPAPEQPAPARTAVTGGDTSLVESIRRTVADLLKFELVDIDIDTHFYAYGFESLALAKLSTELNANLGVDLTPAVFFECPDIRSLSEHLRSRYGAELASDEPPAAAPSPETPPSPAPAPSPETPPRPVAPAYDDGAVAIVGAAGRFPGADDLDTFWQRLRDGADLIGAYPDDRFDDRYAGTVERADFPKWAGQVDAVDRFDAEFFNLSPLEAELMDPQHRLALETVWAALDNGGYAPARLPANTGVYVGVSGNDYHHLLNASGVAPDGFIATGNAHSMLANRISFVLDINGPSEPIDTACSSSLIALHRAVESIRGGRCDMALAGGVNLLLSVDTFAATQAGMLSPDGRCKTF